MIRITLEITCKSKIAKTIEIYSVDGRKIQARAMRKIPNLWRYQSLELKTMIGNFRSDQLDMSTSVSRWLIRDLVKNPKFIMRTLFNTHCFEIFLESFAELPISVSSTMEDGRLWISRHSLWVGLKPSDLEGTLEEERLKNPLQFSAMVRMASYKSNVNEFQYEMHEQQSYSLQTVDKSSGRDVKFFIEAENLVDAQIFHARAVVVENQILQMSNKRNPLLPRTPGFIDEFNGRYRVFKLFEQDLEVENALYIGTATNWFHFIVELAVRIGGVSRDFYWGKPIILESGAHRNILQLCFLMTGVEPIQVVVGQCIYVKNLTILREFGVEDPIDPVQRTAELKEFACIISAQIPASQVEISSKLYFRRPSHLYRPLQNEKEVASFLESKGFQSVYPEQFSLIDFISMLKNADFVVAESGAAITNMMFAKPRTKFLEITPALVTPDFWRSFIEVFEEEYLGIQGEISRFGSKGYAFDGYKISIKKISEILSQWNI